MTKEEIINQITALKEEMREMVSNAEVQTRSLNDEEKAQFEEKQNKLNELKQNLAEAEAAEQRSIEAEAKENKENKTNKTMSKTYLKNLAQQVSDVVNNRSLEEYNNIAGNTINLRNDAYTQTGDVDDVQLLEYTRVIEPLENAVIFDKLGLTYMNTGSLVKLPSVTGVECTINGENTKLETQKVEYSNKAITPVRLGCAVGISNTAIKTVENNQNLVGYSLKAMREAEGRLINKMLLAPKAVSHDGQTVKGLFVDALADASVGSVNWENIIALETAVKDNNAVITDRAAWVMSPATADKLRSKEVALKGKNKIAGFIMEDGKIDGIPVYQTNEVKAYDASANLDFEYIGFCADWSTVIVQEVGAPDLVIDPYTRAKYNETELVLNDNLGFSHERDAVFACMKIDDTSWTPAA